MSQNKRPSSSLFLYLSIILIIIGVILMAVGTTTLTYPSEVFTVNGMTLSSSITKNYFWNFVGLTIFLFGIGGLLSYIEIRRKGMRA